MATSRRRRNGVVAEDDMLTVIRAGYANGTPVAEISRQLGVSRNVVIGKAWRAGLEHPGAMHKGDYGPRRPDRDLAIANCVVNGISVKDMAAVHDFTSVGIRQVVRKHCRCVRKGNPYQPSIWRWRDEQSSAGA